MGRRRYDGEVRRIRKLVPAALRMKLPKRIAVIAVSRLQSRALNRVYRRKNRPANVLAFRYDSSYGEIALCVSLIRADAHKEARPLNEQVTRMILHAMIHLAGLHHERSEIAARRSAALERQAVSALF